MSNLWCEYSDQECLTFSCIEMSSRLCPIPRLKVNTILHCFCNIPILFKHKSYLSGDLNAIIMPQTLFRIKLEQSVLMPQLRMEQMVLPSMGAAERWHWMSHREKTNRSQNKDMAFNIIMQSSHMKISLLTSPSQPRQPSCRN